MPNILLSGDLERYRDQLSKLSILAAEWKRDCNRPLRKEPLRHADRRCDIGVARHDDGCIALIGIKDFDELDRGRTRGISNGVIEIEAVDEENRSSRRQKKPPDRNPEEASGPQPG
jgi:hypothetical protein